jgi:serine/threonine protein kinase
MADFGVARMSNAEYAAAERTSAGAMVGTPAYMSPEQVQGLSIDHRTDIFSAGVLLYQLLTNARPFTGTGAWAIAKKIVLENPPAPSAVNASLLPELDKIVLKALAKEPDQRYGRACEFAAALQRVLQGGPAEEGADAVQSGTLSADQQVELEFWRSIKDSDDRRITSLSRTVPQELMPCCAAQDCQAALELMTRPRSNGRLTAPVFPLENEFSQRSFSRRRNARYSAGVVGAATAPSSLKRVCISGERIARIASRFKRSTMLAGVAAGATSPV